MATGKQTSNQNKGRLILTILLVPLILYCLVNIFTDNDKMMFVTWFLLLSLPLYVMWKTNLRAMGNVKRNTPVWRGIVKGFQKSTANAGGFSKKQKQVWNFNIECYDKNNGQLIDTIPVQMSGDAFNGAISEGDDVEVFNWKKGKLLKTNMVVVHHNQSKIKVRAVNHTSAQTLNWIFFLVVIAIILIFLIAKNT